jgi:hypothetical protein
MHKTYAQNLLKLAAIRGAASGADVWLFLRSLLQHRVQQAMWHVANGLCQKPHGCGIEKQIFELFGFPLT